MSKQVVQRAVLVLVVVLALLSGCSANSSTSTSTMGTTGQSSVAPGAEASDAAGGSSASTSGSAAATPAAFTYTGRLTGVEVDGPVSHYRDRVVIWTPPSYASGRGTYPVLMGLHGWPGSPRMVFNNLRLLDAATTESAVGAVAEPVIVMPQWGEVDTECTNGDAAHQVETWLSVDVPAWVRTHYRVRSGPQNWATLGFSAGAYCAAMLAMRHPTVFGAAISLSGYSQPWFEPGYVPFSTTSAAGRAYDLALVAGTAKPAVALYLLTDPKDKESAPGTARLVAAIKAPTRCTSVQGSGGHSVKLWIPQVRLSLAWLGRTLNGFRPA